MKNMIITIDGYVATGKGTTAKGVAQKLGILYYDTGAVRRGTTLCALEKGLLDATDKEKVAMLDQLEFSFSPNKQTGNDDFFLFGKNREEDIRSTELALKMKPIVTCKPLRQKMKEISRQYAEKGSMVVDGRDAGTVLFPHASLKVFLTCDSEVRLKRRIKQLKDAGRDVDEEKIRKEIQQRDEHDYLGKNAINKKADDARILDTTNCTIDEQIETIVQRAKEFKKD